MWVEELKIKNIKCFDDSTIRFAHEGQRYPWVTFLSENGGGKSTALQALALLLAGPESIPSLQPRPLAWLRDELKSGVISTRVHQGANDPGSHGTEKVRKVFGYSYHVTGSAPLTIRNRRYSEPTVVESADNIKNLSWLRQNAFTANGTGWFAAGYGAFRRLTRSSQIIVPSLDLPARYSNFSTLFEESEPLTAFERWMVYLDYRVSKAHDTKAERQREMGIDVINKLLPEGAVYDGVTDEARIQFDINGTKVPTVALSDGYRSILALAGDMVWRLINAFPDSPNPLQEEGVVLIDELDIHLHPTWQRSIAGALRRQFPGIQFIVATHSPFIAAGAGDDALTLKFNVRSGAATVSEVKGLWSKSVDEILQSPAFGLLSTYSPETQDKLTKFDSLQQKQGRRTQREEMEYQLLLDFVAEARPYGGPPILGSLEDRIEKYLERSLP
jgi:hypothetical protein